ncbi:MAG TPA: hypothetical protein VFU86_21210 [Terriglobales bacterium]|nr:hypothetical protein [Terriglobales bacterium]
MKPLRFLALSTIVFVFLCVTLSAFAQENNEEKHEKSMTAGKQSVTGCLQKGDEAGEYSITGDDGKTYGLRSSAVDLSKHVGHKVTITGTTKAESAEKESAEKEKTEAAEKGKMESNEAGDIRVTKLKMISEKCQ